MQPKQRGGENNSYFCPYLILDVIISNNSQEKCAAMTTQGSVLDLKYVISNLGFKSVLEA